MSQSAFIGAALIAAFVLFLSAKGRLTTYADVLWGNTTAQLPSVNSKPLLAVTGGTGTGAALAALPTLQGGSPGEGFVQGIINKMTNIGALLDSASMSMAPTGTGFGG